MLLQLNTGGKIGIAIGGIIVAIAIIFLFTNVDDLVVEDIEEFTSEVELTNPTQTIMGTYKYSSVCEIGDLEKFFGEQVVQIHSEIVYGKHNENELLITFFKENELLKTSGITPSEILGPDTPPNKDPIFYDVMFYLPVTLEIMNISPELIEFLTPNEGENPLQYETRLKVEENNCR